MGDKKTYRDKYPQFCNDKGIFDKNLFYDHFDDIEQGDIEEILGRRKSMVLYLDNEEVLKTLPLESVGLITLMQYKYARTLERLQEEIKKEFRDRLKGEVATVAYCIFTVMDSGLRQATIETIRKAISQGFNSTAAAPATEIRGCGWKFNDPEGCS